MKRIFASLGGLAVAATLALGGAGMAFADDAPTEPVTTDAPISEAAPVVIESTVETIPENAPVIEAAPEEPVTDDAARVAVALPAVYKPVLWKASYLLDPKFPQYLEYQWDETTTPSLEQFSNYVAKVGTCGTTYQGDLYAADAKTYELIKVGVLNGGEESWVGGSYKDEYSIVITTADCPAPPVEPIECISIPGWTTEDVAPVQTEAGLLFQGSAAPSPSVNTYQRVSQGNLQGLSYITYEVAESAGYTVLVKIEIDPNGPVNPGGPESGYTTLSSVLDVNATGTIDAYSGLWYSSRTAYGNPGGQGNPLSFADITALFPDNTLLSAPSLHLQSSAGEASRGVVTGIDSDCGSTSFVPAVPEPIYTSETDDGVLTCDEVKGGGEIVYTTNVYVSYPTWDAETSSYVYGEPELWDSYTETEEVPAGEDCPTPPVVIPPVTPPADGTLAFTGSTGPDAMAANIGIGALVLGIAALTGSLLWTRRKTSPGQGE